MCWVRSVQSAIGWAEPSHTRATHEQSGSSKTTHGCPRSEAARRPPAVDARDAHETRCVESTTDIHAPPVRDHNIHGCGHLVIHFCTIFRPIYLKAAEQTSTGPLCLPPSYSPSLSVAGGEQQQQQQQQQHV